MAKFVMSLEYVGKLPDTPGNEAEVVEYLAHLMKHLQFSGQKVMFLDYCGKMAKFAISLGQREKVHLLGQMGTVLQPLDHKKGLVLGGKMWRFLETLEQMMNVLETLSLGKLGRSPSSKGRRLESQIALGIWQRFFIPLASW